MFEGFLVGEMEFSFLQAGVKRTTKSSINQFLIRHAVMISIYRPFTVPSFLLLFSGRDHDHGRDHGRVLVWILSL